MPHKGHFPGSPADWLRYARSDLELARVVRPDEVLFEGLCFHAQQAAEKALKAVLIAKGVPPPKTHNIRTLLDLLPQEVIAPQEIEDQEIADSVERTADRKKLKTKNSKLKTVELPLQAGTLVTLIL